jgi:PKD repeat protein
LGDGKFGLTIYNRFIPEENVPSGVTAIFAGGNSSLYIKSDGSLWGMGYNGYGQIGPAFAQSSVVATPAPIVPDLPFSASPTNGQVPLLVQFTSDNVDTFDDTVVEWTWNFGDGSSSDEQNPTHIYTSPGNYVPTLSAIDNQGNVVVGIGPPLISAEPTNLLYSASVTNGLVPLNVFFSAAHTDADGNAITYWSWSFGDGATSGLENPSHTYTSPGSYTVALTATNALGDSLTGTGPTNITVMARPALVFSASPTNGPPPLTVQFGTPAVDSLGNAIVAWNWDFGDGVGSSTQSSPTYVYNSFGNYQPSLNVENSLGEFFNASGPGISVFFTVNFTACPTNGKFPVTVQFTGPSIDSEGYAVTSWNWDFGDGMGTSSLQNPTYVYTSPGVYQPALNVEDGQGNDFNVTGPMINLSSSVFNSGLVVNGGFETGDFTGWCLTNYSGGTATEVDGFALDGNYGADFFQSGSLDYLSQLIPTTPGATYLLSFWLDSPDGLTPNEFLASWNGTTLFDEVNMPATGWTNIQYVVTSPESSTVLKFGGRDDPSDLGLDDVSVTSAQPGIASLKLSGSNLVLCGTNGISGQSYFVLESGNIATPLAQWTPILTNIACMEGPFTITITNAVQAGIGQKYFVVELK